MRRYVSNDQDWEKVDDEDCWEINYTEPTAQIREKIETILHTWGEEQPEEEQDELTKLNPETESGPLSMDGAQWHLLKHTLTNASPNSLGSCLQNELTRQLELDKDKKHRSFS